MSTNDNQKPLPSYYSPHSIEQKRYAEWESKGYFTPSQTKSKKSFSVLLPPPNVTGSLHLGHALNHTIQDCLIRHKKMSGLRTVWLPGTDHAGIATQIKVEQALAKKGIKKEQIGREKFLEHAWDWKKQYGDTIINQMKHLGDACDWSKHLFTLDPSSVAAVKKAFVHFYNKKWIYRGTRLVNWSPKLSSAISDLEVEYRQVKSSLWKIKYPLENNKNEFLIIATTRPETLIADQAVAVHPLDERYKKYHGQRVILPLVHRALPVISDEYVDPQFGTGVLKITPAHDFNDYKLGKKYKLEELNILNPEGSLNKQAGKYQGLSIKEARERIVADLESAGLLESVEPYSHQVAFCSRSGGVVEPFLSQQWFLKMDDLAQRGLQVVERGEVEIIPYSWVKTFQHWMNNLDDWCLSRQLWWGHRIPAWYCLDCKEISVSEDDLTQCQKCLSSNLKEEEDVLDTWFSSALWPMSVLKWPETKIKESDFFPSSVLVTGPDILFFWVARMIIMSLEFQDQVPFKKVYLHGIVRDEQGRKMSKSLGNGEDPLDLIKEFGADALRLSLLSSHAKGRDVKFSRNNIETCRNFLNKIWNAYRFIDQLTQNQSISTSPQNLNFSAEDQWILSKLKQTEIKVNKELEEFRFSSACLHVYNFAWMEFCDWYLEWIKPIVYGDDEERKQTVYSTLHYVFNRILRLLHPFTPFLTEELYQNMGNNSKESIMLDTYPNGQDLWFNYGSQKMEGQLDLVKDIISTIRQMRGENQIKHSDKIEATIIIPSHLSSDRMNFLQKLQKSISNKIKFKQELFLDQWIFDHKDSIIFLAKLKSIQLGSKPEKGSFSASMPLLSFPDITVLINLEGVVDKEAEKNRLDKKLQKLQAELDKINQQLNLPSFTSNAPSEVVTEKQKRKKEIQLILNQLKESLERL